MIFYMPSSCTHCVLGRKAYKQKIIPLLYFFTIPAICQIFFDRLSITKNEKVWKITVISFIIKFVCFLFTKEGGKQKWIMI